MQAQNQDRNQHPDQNQLVMSPDKKADIQYGNKVRAQDVEYTAVSMDKNGKTSSVENASDHNVELKETLVSGDSKKVTTCTGQCVGRGSLTDTMQVTAGKRHSVEKRFEIDGKAARVYDPETKKAYDFVRVDASVRKGFVFNYGNDPN